MSPFARSVSTVSAVTIAMLAALACTRPKEEPLGVTTTTSAAVRALASCDTVREQGSCFDYASPAGSFGVERSLCRSTRGDFRLSRCPTAGRRWQLRGRGGRGEAVLSRRASAASPPSPRRPTARGAGLEAASSRRARRAVGGGRRGGRAGQAVESAVLRVWTLAPPWRGGYLCRAMAKSENARRHLPGRHQDVPGQPALRNEAWRSMVLDDVPRVRKDDGWLPRRPRFARARARRSRSRSSRTTDPSGRSPRTPASASVSPSSRCTRRRSRRTGSSSSRTAMPRC